MLGMNSKNAKGDATKRFKMLAHRHSVRRNNVLSPKSKRKRQENCCATIPAKSIPPW